MTPEKYFLQYINPNYSGCLVCENPTKFRNITVGYLATCSLKCNAKLKKTTNTQTKYWLGKKQSEQHITKRISNTDQIKKQESNKSTLLEKYGVSNASLIQDIQETRSQNISKALTGKKKTKEHVQKIIDSKIANGTIKHTQDTKQLISELLLDYYKDNSHVNKEKCLPKYGKGGKHLSGEFNGIWFRSKNELDFLVKCQIEDIEVISASNSKYSLTYLDKCGRMRTYFPDFYLPQYDVVVEIKNKYLQSVEANKISAAKEFYGDRFLLTEWINCESVRDFLNEHICSRQ